MSSVIVGYKYDHAKWLFVPLWDILLQSFVFCATAILVTTWHVFKLLNIGVCDLCSKNDL